jgi:hypothetical protein
MRQRLGTLILNASLGAAARLRSFAICRRRSSAESGFGCWRRIIMAKPYRCAASALALLTLLVAAPARADPDEGAQILDTPGFTIRIEVRCPEGNVTCETVAYRGKSKRTGQVLALMGRTAHTTCADRVTPCRFLGYIFRSGAYSYFVSEAGDLVVSKGDKELVREAGAWR